jgi:tRNA (guanine37-N1)-methyltransferase
MMRIDILTLFPEMFEKLFEYSIIGRARESNVVQIKVHNIRDYAHDKHKIVDDYPYGGGAGMVMKPEPIFETIESVKTESNISNCSTVLLSPKGRLFNQNIAKQLSLFDQIIFICGRYEGIDERVADHIATDEISIGDYILSGGEIPAMTVIDSIIRLLPGAIGSEQSLVEESHEGGLLEYPQYTRPAEYRGWQVPSVLLSGNHSEIARWRHSQSLLLTAAKRPDLITKISMTKEEKAFLHQSGIDINN